ncbi:MAG TPA: GNAT family N-acetyltransferase, partial [Nocardioides sp.]|nr:GNAT family N-acetyltransferase [Nocardioides sp.]
DHRSDTLDSGPAAQCHGAVFRAASRDDLVALCELERAANLAALGHVFPPERYPFPVDDVLARWSIVLEDPDVAVMVAEEAGELVALAAYDSSTLRHLAVRPDRWGHGLASSAVETVVHALDLRGCTIASLWCLEENHRARRLYEWLGWRPTNDRREAPWPPYPVELRYTRLIPQSDR